MLHTCWLFLTPEARLRHTYVLEILSGDLMVAPFVFYEGFYPGNRNSTVRFQVHEKKVAAENLPELILTLTVGHAVLIWAAPAR
jgi:hypothetical protein